MKPQENYIIVEVDQNQKDEAIIGGQRFSTGRNYNENFREKNPVVAHVIEGHVEIHKGMWLVCNYSTFDWDSPFYIGDNLFSIPVDEEIFAWVGEEGELYPLNGNLMVKRIGKKYSFELPDDYKKNYWDRGVILNDGNGYKSGDQVFWMKMADYEICFTWNGQEKRVVKVHNKEIVGILRK